MKCARESCKQEIGLLRYPLRKPQRHYCCRTCYLMDIRQIEKDVNGDLALYKHPAAMLALLLGLSPAFAIEPGNTFTLTYGIVCDEQHQMLDILAGAKESEAKAQEVFARYTHLNGHGGRACGIVRDTRFMVLELIGETTNHEGSFEVIKVMAPNGMMGFTALNTGNAKPAETAL